MGCLPHTECPLSPPFHSLRRAGPPPDPRCGAAPQRPRDLRRRAINTACSCVKEEDDKEGGGQDDGAVGDGGQEQEELGWDGYDEDASDEEEDVDYASDAEPTDWQWIRVRTKAARRANWRELNMVVRGDCRKCEMCVGQGQHPHPGFVSCNPSSLPHTSPLLHDTQLLWCDWPEQPVVVDEFSAYMRAGRLYGSIDMSTYISECVRASRSPLIPPLFSLPPQPPPPPASPTSSARCPQRLRGWGWGATCLASC